MRARLSIRQLSFAVPFLALGFGAGISPAQTIGGVPLNATLAFSNPTGTVSPAASIPVQITLSLAPGSAALTTDASGNIIGLTAADITPYLYSGRPAGENASDAARSYLTEFYSCGPPFSFGTSSCGMTPYNFTFNSTPPSFDAPANFSLTAGNSVTDLMGTFTPACGAAPTGTYTLPGVGLQINVFDGNGNPLAFILIADTQNEDVLAFTRTVVTTVTTYTYQGNNYTTCSGTYCTGGPYALSVTFDTTLTGSALDNLPFTNIASTITSFTFTDGSGLTLDSNIGQFYISTNASGNLVSWVIGACGATCDTQMQTNWDSPSSFSPGIDFSETSVSFTGSYGEVSNDPGKWSGPGAAFPASEIATTASGLLYSRVTRTYNGTVTITNISGGVLGGPFPIMFTSLTPGVTLTNATGTGEGGSCINPGVSSLAPGQSVTADVQFSNPSNAIINFTPVIY
jgi:hypothetical protein